MKRRLYLDLSPGEQRGVVTLGGKPERLLIERGGVRASERLGAVSIARVARIERALGMVFLELPDGGSAVTPLITGMVEGAAVEITIMAEPRLGKAATAAIDGAGEGAPRLLTHAPDLAVQLRVVEPDGDVITGADARSIADLAQEAALAVEHPLPGGGSIAIEPTRALVAIDVDLGARTGGDARRAARQANLAAIAEAARLLRLKGLGGPVVIDLAGKGHDGAAMSAAAKAAFSPDGPQVSIGPISRFGLFELTLPRHRQPVLEMLSDQPGEANAETLALDLLRALEREGRANPGSKLVGRAAPSIVEAASRHSAALTERLGPRFSLSTDPGQSIFEVDVL